MTAGGAPGALRQLSGGGASVDMGSGCGTGGGGGGGVACGSVAPISLCTEPHGAPTVTGREAVVVLFQTPAECYVCGRTFCGRFIDITALQLILRCWYTMPRHCLCMDAARGRSFMSLRVILGVGVSSVEQCFQSMLQRPGCSLAGPLLVTQKWFAYQQMQISPVMETIEDMLTRLEEFESLMDMVRTDVTQSAVATVPDIVACKSELRTLCDRIDCLEALVTRVRRDLDTVESQLDTAEATVGGEGVIRNMLKPLFFKKSDPLSRAASSPSYQLPEIFKTDDYFPKTEESGAASND